MLRLISPGVICCSYSLERLSSSAAFISISNAVDALTATTKGRAELLRIAPVNHFSSSLTNRDPASSRLSATSRCWRPWAPNRRAAWHPNSLAHAHRRARSAGKKPRNASKRRPRSLTQTSGGLPARSARAQAGGSGSSIGGSSGSPVISREPRPWVKNDQPQRVMTTMRFAYPIRNAM